MDIIDTAKKKIESEITDIENRTDLSDDEKRTRIIHIFSVTCAAVAVQPIPFADIFVLTPIQAYMGVRLSAIRGMLLSEAEATDLLKEIAGIVGIGLAAQQIALGLYKVGLPGLAGFTTIPLVYGLTYAIGRIMDYYLEKKFKGQTISNTDLQNVWKKYRQEGKVQAKKAKDEVKAKKDDFSPSEMASEKTIKKVIDYLDMAETIVTSPELTADNAERYIYYLLIDGLQKKSNEVPSRPDSALVNKLWLELEKKALDNEDWDEDEGELFVYRYLKNELLKNSPNEVCDLIVEVIEDEGGFGELTRELEDVLQDEGNFDLIMSEISKLKS